MKICPVCEQESLVSKGKQRSGSRAYYCKVCQASRTEGVDYRSVAYTHGHNPELGLHFKPPKGMTLDKLTHTLYSKDGSTVVHHKLSTDKEQRLEALKVAVDELLSDIKPCAPTPPPRRVVKDLANAYFITDYHIGMMAWGEETRGDDWDSKLAESTLIKWFSAAIAQAPDAEVGIFVQMGDFLHYDSLDAVTPTSRHLLDADTRFQKLIRIAIRVTRKIISMLLQKHKKVHVIHAEGNHDMASSGWLREMSAAFYEGDKRVTVDVSPDPYYCYEFGNAALFVSHGHKAKLGALDVVFTAKFRDVFGRTKYCYGHAGHMHHLRLLESSLMLIEQHQTLAPNDSHGSRGGWLSARSAQVITYSRKYGEVGRIRITPEMLK